MTKHGESSSIILYSWHEFKIYYRIQEECGQKSVWIQRGARWMFMRNMADAEYNLLYRERVELWQKRKGADAQ